MFEIFSFFSSGGHFVHGQNHLGIFGKWPYEEHLCEIIFNLAQQIRK